MQEKKEGKRELWRHALILGGVVAILLIIGLIFRKDIARFAGRLFRGEITKESAKNFMRSFGWHGMVVIPCFSMLQVVLTFLPAEPVQVVAGMSYGFWGGVGLCMLGVFAGNNVMYLLSRTFGARLTRYFRKNIDVDLSAGTAAGRISLAVLILYLLPAIPYGLICFLSASTGMKYLRYILLTTLGSLPSVMIGAALGVIAMEMGLIVALITLAVLIVLITVMFCFRKRIFAAINRSVAKANAPYSTAHRVRKPNAFIYGLSAITVGGFIKHKIKLKIFKDFKRLPRPAVVLCNHPSFVDWAYAALALRPDRGNFIIARYYYYHRKLAWLVKQVGTMPKSMFTTDVESARNAFRVIKENGVLCLMPEARLSTAGKTETISDMTTRMVGLLGAPVYTVKIDGAYLAKPKWGKGFRKRAPVEVRVEKLADADEVRSLSCEELHGRIENALSYNDFAWLKERPEIRYKSKRLAEGLENVLLRCPDCGKENTLATEGNRIWCTHCGLTAQLDERYAFHRTDGKSGAIPENPQVWYDWTENELRKEIGDGKAYALKDDVQLKFPDPTGKQFFAEAGSGVCTLNLGEGFRFEGTVRGESHTLEVPQRDLFRLLFGAGENFEIYHEKEFYYFIPPDVRSCVKWYIVSGILHDKYEKTQAGD